LKETLKAIRTSYPERKIWALFEPRSNTTTRNIFQHELANSFDDADVILIGAVNRPERFAPDQRLSPEKLIASLQQKGKEAYSIPDVDEMISFVISQVSSKDVIVLLSNGEFGGARKKIIDELKVKEK
jgi:UDP-N-acetylmuramate: L-alanyl-gamma-D-glutamyl-meso-diaminopimelate ligase